MNVGLVMTEQEFKTIVAGKIAYYRKRDGITQGELAQYLNYSDKSVSKWERGEGIPDAYVLSRIAERFGVTMNDLTNGGEPAPSDTSEDKKKYIIVLSVGLAWLTASVVFFILKLIVPDLEREWLTFIYAIPVSFIVTTVFSCIWYGMLLRTISVSGIIWGVFLSVILTFPISKILYLLIICAVFQIIVIIWFIMRYKTTKQL